MAAARVLRDDSGGCMAAARVLRDDSGGCVAAARVLRDDSGCGCAGKAPQRGSRQQEPERVPQRVPGV